MENRGGYIPGCEERAKKMGQANRKYPAHRKWWAYHLQHDYRLSLEMWDTLIQQSNGHCDICAKQFTNEKQSLNIDHCHNTGKVRGLLCSRCNTLLAGLEDYVFKLLADKYLIIRGH